MGRTWNNFAIRIDNKVYVIAALAILLLPFKILFAFLLAVFVHEFFHYMALRAVRASVRGIKLCATGIEMQTAALTCRQELLCSLAGPVGSLLVVIGARHWPYTSLFAFGQLVFNLIPAYPLDGGRALRCILLKLCGTEWGSDIFRVVNCVAYWGIAVSIFILIVYLKLYYLWIPLLYIFICKLIPSNPLKYD